MYAQENSPTIISTSKAEFYMNNWAEAINKYDSNSNKDLKEFFTDGSNGYVYGYSLDMNDYNCLTGKIGVESFKVRFGLDENNRIRLVLWASSPVGGDNVYFCPDYGKSLSATPPAKPISGSDISYAPGKVPYYLVKQWWQNWSDIFEKGSELPVNIFRVKIEATNLIGENIFIDEALRGYTYRPTDFYDVVMAPNEAGFKEVRFHFVNHKDGTRPEDGFFGLVISAPYTLTGSKRDDDEEGTSYYDISTPCPSTC